MRVTRKGEKTRYITVSANSEEEARASIMKNHNENGNIKKIELWLAYEDDGKL